MIEEEGLKRKNSKIETNGIKRTICSLEDKKSPFLGFGELGHTFWRKAKFWVDSSPFLALLFQAKRKEGKLL